MHIGNLVIKRTKITFCFSKVSFFWGSPVGADYLKTIQKIFGISNMYYSKFLNICTPLLTRTKEEKKCSQCTTNPCNSTRT